MVSITKESLEDLRQKVDLVDLLSSYLDLKKSGAYYKACCPFHQEKSPSFVIQTGSSFYHCFGCRAHGDAIGFLMEHQHLSFIEAVEFLAERYQVALEYDQQVAQDHNKKRLIELLTCANQFFHSHLLHSTDGKEAREYLAARDIDLPFINKFEIGLAPVDGKALVKHLSEQKYTVAEMEDVGLLNQYGSSFFYDRITFPIKSAQGAVIGFSARLYKETTQGGKYINSKETFLFKKSNVLFGLNYSRMRLAKGKKVLIVEGQIDALRLIHLGLNATVAPLGTALTDGHVDKLKQLGVEQAYLAFDSDNAGINAALKSGHLLQKNKITTFIIPMPTGADPDSFLRENGAKGFTELLNKKVDYLSFLVRRLGMETDQNDPANKSRLIEKIVERVKEWEDPVMVYESLKKVSQLMQIPLSTMGVTESTPMMVATAAKLKQNQLSLQQYIEVDVLVWLLQRDLPTEEFLSIAQQNLVPDLFQDAQCKSIYQILFDHFQAKTLPDTLSLLIQSPDESTQKLIGSLMEKKIHKEHAKERFIKALQHLLDVHWMNKKERIKNEIQSGYLSDEEAIEKAKEYDKIQKERPSVKI